jgi:C4-dicarboxylate-specific signal transduction histidine kinase
MDVTQITVLLIEDEEDHRQLVQRHLRCGLGVSFVPRVVDRLAAGLDQLRHATFDAVLLDLHLPDSSGLDTLRRVRQSSAEVAVVILSALDDQELAVQAVHEGAQDYLVKSDISSELLSRAIRYAIERRKNETQLERLVNERTGELLRTNRRLELEIEQHKLARQRLAQQQQRLLQAERLAAIGEMATGLAHESRNALQRSQACLTMLSHRLEDQPKVHELLHRAQEAQDDLSRLHEQVRQYASPIQLAHETCLLDDLVRQAWEQLELDRSGRHVELELVPQARQNIWVDRFALVQVFRNLLENALAACTDPVHITVNWQPDSATKSLVVTIRDNGPGFEPARLPRLFQPFCTTKVRGTGLGLAISQRLIQAHGGQIAAANHPQGGAMLDITLPLHGAV